MRENMKKTYFSIEAEVVMFAVDIITSSTTGELDRSVGTAIPDDWVKEV